MFQTILFWLQVLGMLSFVIGLWFNFHQRSARTPMMEKVRVFFHAAEKRSGKCEAMNAALVVAALVSIVQFDYRIFVAALGASVVTGSVLNVTDKYSAMAARAA